MEGLALNVVSDEIKKAVAFYDETIVPLAKALKLGNSRQFALETPENITANVLWYGNREGTDQDTTKMMRDLSHLARLRERKRCETIADWVREKEVQKTDELTDMDTRHIIHSIMNERGGIEAPFEYKDIDVLAMILLAQQTGLSNFELQTLALAGFRFEKREVDGITIRTLKMQYCWKEGVGVGIYDESITDTEKIEHNAIIFVLWKLERMGVIKSASHVYAGEELLLPNSDVYETAEVLRSKLEMVSSRAPDNREIQAFMQGKAEPPEALMNDLIEQEQRSPQDYSTPCWIDCNPDDSQFSDGRMAKSTADGYICNFICQHGYRCPPTNKIGIASARLYYCGLLLGLG